MITGVKFLQLVSPDSITVLKFAAILPDTSRPPNMCYCGKTFDNVLEVAAHDTEAHKKGYKCEYKICDEEEERLPHKMKTWGVHPEIICVECKTTFSQINKLKIRNTLKSVGTKLQSLHVTSAQRHIGTSAG